MSCCGGNSGVVSVANSSNRSSFRYNNEETCGVTVDRLRVVDINVTKEYLATRNPYLLSINTELRRLINSFNRTNVCELLTQIQDWEATYGGG